MSDNTNTPQLPPAGWYPDPHDPAEQRFWDGTQWTERAAVSIAETASTVAMAPAPSTATSDGAASAGTVPADTVPAGGAFAVSAKRGLPRLTWWQWALIAFGALVLISIIVNAVSGGRASSDADAARPAASTAQEVEASEAPVETVEVPDLVGSTVAEARAELEAIGLVLVPGEAGDDWIVTAQQPLPGSHPLEGIELSITSEAPKPVYTLAQQNAIGKAQDYLAYSGFSRGGLIGQLEYEGFSTEEATFGADNAGADWNAEAAEKAEDYLKYSSFSRDGLYQQLEYEQFTPEQIAFGLAAVGY